MNNEFLLEYEKFKQIILKYKGEKIYFGDFEKLLFNTMQKIDNSKEKKHLFIGIDKELTFVLYIIYLSINEYLKNMYSIDNNILNDIKHGDKVVKNGQLLKFDKIDNGYIYMKNENEKCNVNIPIEKSYILTKYAGEASRINKSSKKSNIAKDFLLKLLEIEQNKFKGDIKNTSLIIVENKEQLYNTLDSIEIIFEEEKFKLTEVFPFSYYSSGENSEFFKGNKIKQNALVKFTINPYTALDLVREDENIKNVIFIGNNTYKNSIDSEIRQIELYDPIEKIIIIDTWESSCDYSIFDEEFSIYALSKNVILENVNLYSNEKEKYVSEIQKYNNTLLFNLVNREINIYQIDNNGEVDTSIYDICIKLKSLYELSYDNMQILDFLKISYSLCNKFEQIIIPLKRSLNNNKIIYENLKTLQEINNIFPENRFEYTIMKDIIDQFKKIKELIFNSNYKSQFILTQYLSKKRKTLLIKNKNEFNVAKLFYIQYPSCKIDVKLFDIDNKQISYENMIIPFYLDAKKINIIESNKVLNLDLLVYRREKNRINSLINRTVEMLKYIESNNKLLESEEEIELPIINRNYLNKINDMDLSYDEEFVDTENKVGKLIENNLLNIYLTRNSYNTKEYSVSTIIKKFIIFKDGNYAFLTSNYKANVLDESGTNIKLKELENLNINDNIIFPLNRANNSEEDIVKVILKKLLENSQFNEKYEQFFRLNRLWKDELKNYMMINNFNEQNISNEFKFNSRIVNKVTIINWLNGSIIGPRDSEDIRVAIKIINKPDLSKQIEKIVEACQNERKIQVHVRKALAKIIINSVVSENSEESEIEKLIRLAVKDISRYTYIGTISSIKDISENMNTQYVNRIIEKEV